MHARGYQSAGGFKVVAVADLIPQRRKKLIEEFKIEREVAEAKELLAQKDLDAVSVCLPNHLHAAITIAALRAGKHVVCEKPPAMNAKEAQRIAAAAQRAKKVVLYSVQRRFGGAEQAAKQAIAKGYAGDVYHARSAWTRTRGIPIGTGWFTHKDEAGGGALIDIGVHMLDLAWHMLGQPKPTSVFGAVHQRFSDLAPKNVGDDVEDSAFALIRFENGKSLELATSWALNQPPQQQGTICRIYGDKAGVDVYTPNGSVIYRGFSNHGDAKPTPLKPPKVTGHTALMRHFRECVNGKSQPLVGPTEGVMLMKMIDAIYKSARTGKSVAL
jgi:predicted dehydrogenase